ncbi:cytochrome P450 [Xylariomycetidae sp. FL2044]|nr:cytochrome P450 [Xylariomycetidae sp. FL2044]
MKQSRAARKTIAECDFYVFIYEDPDADEARKKESLWWEAHFLVVAVSDTGVTAITTAFFYLTHNPECSIKLALEIRSKFVGVVEIESGPSCQAVNTSEPVNESLRISPPGPGIMWKTQDPDDDEHLISASSTQSSSRTNLARSVLAAFSTGSCAYTRKSMAYLETSLILAKTLWYFDFEPTTCVVGKIGGGSSHGALGRSRSRKFPLEDIFTSRYDGPYLTFCSRDAQCEDLE